MTDMTDTHTQTPCPFCGTHSSRYLTPRMADPSDILAFNYVLCPHCRIAFLNPMPSPDAIQHYYRRTYSPRPPEPLADFRLPPSRLRLIRSLPLNPQSDRLLDIGSGKCEAVHALLNLGWDITGVEPYYVPRPDSPQLNARILPSTLHDARLPDASFSLVMLWQVLEHLHNPADVLTESIRILRPGGFLLISIPNLNTFQHLLLREFWPGYGPPEHLFVFSTHSLNRLLNPLGLRLIRSLRDPAYDRWMLKNSLYRYIMHQGRRKQTSPQFSKNFSPFERSLIALFSFLFVHGEALFRKSSTAHLVYRKLPS